MPGVTGPTLDDEGVPDLMGPLAEKERTGDPQEGLAPPGDRPHSDDWGNTAAEVAAGEPLDVRVAHELPDLGETDPVDEVVRDLGLDNVTSENGDPADVEPGEELGDLTGQELLGDDLLEDDEQEMLGAAVATDSLEGQSAEEAAMHVIDE